jgi:hypothetical protein
MRLARLQRGQMVGADVSSANPALNEAYKAVVAGAARAR